MTAKRPPMRRRPSIAENSFAADELFKFYEHAAMTLTAYAELDGVAGLQFIATPRGVLPREDVLGAARLAEASEGPVGRFMRMAREKGYNSKSPGVIRGLEERAHLAHAKGFRGHLRKIRKNKAVIRQEEALEADVGHYLALRDVVDAGQAWIDREIRSDPYNRDIAVEWPKVWRDGVPIPLKK